MWVSDFKIGLSLLKQPYIAILKFPMNHMSRLAQKQQIPRREQADN